MKNTTLPRQFGRVVQSSISLTSQVTYFCFDY
nr:MAG TPA: hypothetical protein [Caudoviricetes sp.]